MAGLRLSELARFLGGEVVGDPEVTISRVRPLDTAGPGDLSFLHNSRYVEQARETGAGAVLLADPGLLPGHNLVVCEEPYLALAQALELMAPEPVPECGVHPTAVVAEDAVIGDGVTIGPHVVIGAGCRVGDGSRLGAGTVLGDGVTVGESCYFHPHVVVEQGCSIGDRCILHAGVVVGSDGFGYATVDGIHHKVPQVGTAVLEDDVELGANVCVDRATLGETRICKGVKVDNLVQIAHNVTIGEGSILVSQVGIAGSTKLGRYVVIAGQSGVAGHLELGDGAQVSGKTAVLKDLPPGQLVSGIPARPRKEWARSQVALMRLPELLKRVKELEKRLERLDSENQG